MAPSTTRICQECGRKSEEPICTTCDKTTLPVMLDGRYELISVLGHGGMGVVFAAVQLSADRMVAIKITDPRDNEAIQRFRRETKLTAKIEHPNAIRVYDSGVSPEGRPYLVMELLKGAALSSEIKLRGPFELHRAVDYICQVLEALDDAHKQGIVHRDVKPSNIFLHNPGQERVTVKIMDFGIAVLSQMDEESGKITRTGVALGSPAYMSPEQLQALLIDARSDLYSTGLVFYEMITGTRPFRGENFAALALKQITEKPTPLSSYRSDLAEAPGLQVVIDRMLAKKPEDRFQTAREAIASIRQVLPDRRAPASDAELKAIPGQEPAHSSGSLSAVVPRDAFQVVPNTLPAHAVTTTSTSQAVAAIRPPGTQRYLLAGFGGVIAVAALLILLWPSGKSPQKTGGSPPTAPGPKPPVSTATSAAQVAPPPAPDPTLQEEKVELRFVSVPPGASITINSVDKGMTPVKVEVARESALAIRLEKAGFKKLETTVKADMTRDVRLEMDKVPVKASPPVSKKTPSGNSTRPKQVDSSGPIVIDPIE